MKKRLLMSDQTLFQDEGVFDFNHVPEQFAFRDAQLKDLAFAVRPGLRGSRPVNAVLRGVPGTGKTTSVHRIFAEIEETTRRLIPVYINCQHDKTHFAVFSKIYKNIIGHLPPLTGIARTRVANTIGKKLDELNAVLLVCLDDANYMIHDRTLNKVLYTLLRMHEEYPGTRVGVFTIMSSVDVDLTGMLDAPVQSVFRPQEIYFPPYDEEEIRAILRERAKGGFYPGGLSVEMLDFIVDRTMESGDLRVGLDLLRRSALGAERDARQEITREDVCAAFEVAKNLPLAVTVRALSEKERDLLRCIAERNRDGAGVLQSGELYEAARGREKMSYTAFFQRVKKLDEMRLINLHAPKQRGRTREIVLRYDAEKVVEVCG
ncbi:MAG TPA: ORC1-type DNA replication protein [Methanoculleus sp.]|mgnify:CR=1 FL=1|nr:ORC1-type DNA replication protein [Methanoculleus sp.]